MNHKQDPIIEEPDATTTDTQKITNTDTTTSVNDHEPKDAPTFQTLRA